MSAAPDRPGVEMARRLRMACEAHDTTICPHLDQVTRFACEIGRELGLAEEQLDDLYYATPLHDVGKIGIPAALLHKPGQLTPQEMEIIKTHTVLGYRILQGSPSPVIACAALVALSHHECWDGRGYPHGLIGAKIPLVARIVAVADVYDALLSARAYKPAWEREQVISEMREMRGKKFDPEIIDLFLDRVVAMSA